MIRIEPREPSGDEYDAWRKRAIKRRDKDIKKWRDASKPNPGPEPYQKLWAEFKEKYLEKVFHGKCAYCEANHGSGFYAHVEHYRPKLAVTDGRKAVEHPGYFWLAYEWENLLLACNHCNSNYPSMRDGVEVKLDGKLNEFKVRGRRVAEPTGDPGKWQDELKAERPLLLNPYFDDPANHLYFNENGMVLPLTEEGRETIEVCGLNRIKLVEERNKAKKLVRGRIEKIRTILKLLEREDEDDGDDDGADDPDFTEALRRKLNSLRTINPSEEFSAWLSFWVRHRTRKCNADIKEG